MNTVFADTLHFSAQSGGPARVTAGLLSALRDSGIRVATWGPSLPAPNRLKLAAGLARRILLPAPAMPQDSLYIAGEIWPVATKARKTAIIIHDTFALVRPESAKSLERGNQRRRIEWAARFAGLVIVPSAEVRRSLAELAPGLKERIHVIPWGIGNEFLSHAPEPPDTESPYVVAAGDRTPRKATPELLAWHRSESGLPRLVTTGRFSPDALVSLMARASAFISFSHDEGYGLAIAEAASLGIPVAARRFPGCEARFPGGVFWFDRADGARTALDAALKAPRIKPAWVTARTWAAAARQFIKAAWTAS
ncbi:MAG: hypothetical protein KIT79_13225 [Deltaproteobacteria bacterium]|nr:hypothetical protein [Deltaproteobacteria bacterium]